MDTCELSDVQEMLKSFSRLPLLQTLMIILVLQFGTGLGRPIWASRIFKPSDGLAHQVGRDIAIAPDGAFWMATWGGGISRFDGSKWETFNDGEPLADFMIRCLAFDPDGGLWAGTPEGIRYFDSQQWTTYTTANSRH